MSRKIDFQESVCDPIQGYAEAVHGTAVLEAMLLGRRGIGMDIDPLALNLSKVKVTHLDPGELIRNAESIIERAIHAFRHKKSTLSNILSTRIDPSTKKFLDYWFLEETQIEIIALVQEIEVLSDPDIRRFFQIALSSIIITKSGGVSLGVVRVHHRFLIKKARRLYRRRTDQQFPNAGFTGLF